jgi:hypothetical protein
MDVNAGCSEPIDQANTILFLACDDSKYLTRRYLSLTAAHGADLIYSLKFEPELLATEYGGKYGRQQRYNKQFRVRLSDIPEIMY